MPLILPSLVDGHRADLARAIAAMPASRLIGLTVRGFAPGVSILDLPVRLDLTFDGRIVQGGIVGVLADYAAVSATIAAKPDGWFAATVSFQVNNVDPANGKTLIAVGRSSGARLGLGVDKIYAIDADRTALVAMATAQCQFIPPPGATADRVAS